MRINKRYNILFIPLLFSISLFLYLCSCSMSHITYFDNTTLHNLTNLKAEINVLYDAYPGGRITDEKISYLASDIHLDIERMIEYENSKGLYNTETVQQFKIIEEMYQGHINERVNIEVVGKDRVNLDNQKELINKALSIAIATERSKNKNE